jgi:hypothetical protein
MKVQYLSMLVLAFGSILGANAQTLTVTDNDVLNFALQAECLAAAFWNAAATGTNLTAAQLGGGGPVIGVQKAVIQGSALELAQEFARNEIAHLEFLRSALGLSALPCPEIDIGYSFNSFVNLTLASLQNYNPYAPFTPYKDFISLYIAGFILADPEVFAYLGAAPLITNSTILEAAAGITAVESYHAGALRQNLATLGSLPTVYGFNVSAATTALATVRRVLQGAPEDLGIGNGVTSTLVDADGNALVFDRSVQQTLAFLYQSGSPVTPGGWFPQGINGVFSVASLKALLG